VPVEFTRPPSVDKVSTGQGVRVREQEAATNAALGPAHSFHTAFVRSRVPKSKGAMSGDTKSSSSGLGRGPCAAVSSVSSAARVAPMPLTAPAHPRTAGDHRAGGLMMAATGKPAAVEKGAREAGEARLGKGVAQGLHLHHEEGDSRSVRAPGAKRFLLLRHGQTNFNAEGRVQGSSDDSRLSELGVKQARDVGGFLDRFRFGKTYVSPLNRARETLRTVGEVMRLEGAVAKAVVDEDLREIDLYEWQGMLKHEIKEQFPDDYVKWRGQGASSFRLPSGNYPVVQLWSRARSVWERVLSEAEEEGVREEEDGSLIVAHNAVIQAMVCTAMGLGEDSFRRFQVPNCGVVDVEWVPGEAMARRWRWLFPAEDSEWHTPDDYLPDKQSADAENTNEILGRSSLRDRTVSLERSSSELSSSEFGS